MPNTLDITGLTIKTLTEIGADLTEGFQTIYGADINVDSNSPDGQIINLFAQTVIDNLELLVDAYSAMDPELATGVNLDKSVALNGILRDPASYTTTPVLVTVNQALTLTGLDALIANPEAIVYAVQDANKNVFQLVTTKVFAVAGSDTLTFKAQEPGAISVLPNTITEQNTPQLGVTSVNNPTVSGTSEGLDEETDLSLKIRRSKMFKLAATGPADAIEAALLAVIGVTDVMVVENDTDAKVDGVDAYSIQCIVNGGAEEDIAQAIYSKKAPGCGMTGGKTYVLTRNNGLTMDIKYDLAVAEDLYIEFTALPVKTGYVFDYNLIKKQLAAYLNTIFRLGDSASIGDIIMAMQVVEPRIIVTACGVSNHAGDYADKIDPTDNVNYFVASDARITIN
jgi:uncharacterized phage protein gp47/JayE